jgi:hypothetical protein
MQPEELPLLSVTQVNLYVECPRKWGFRYLDGIKQPKSPGQLLGTEVQDEQLDPWLSTGRQFDFSRPTHSGEIALALAPLLPAPMTAGVRLRRWFTVPSPRGGFGYQGEMDLCAPDSRVVPGVSLSLGREPAPMVGDIKTTKDLRYAKGEAELATDVQAQLYAMVEMYEAGVDAVDLVWFTSRTRPPWRAQRAVLRVEAAHVAEQFEKIDLIGSEISAIKKSRPKTEDLPPTGAKPRKDLGGQTVCHAYGGCPYQHICNHSPATFAAGWEAPLGDPNTNAFFQSLKKNPAVAPLPANASIMPPIGQSLPGTVHVTATPPIAPPTVPTVPSAQVQTAPEALPAWATAAVDPLHARLAAVRGQVPSSQHSLTVGPVATHVGLTVTPPVINPPESVLPPAPPVGTATASTRGRPKAIVAITQQPSLDWEVLAAKMRAARVQRLVLEGSNVREIELMP